MRCRILLALSLACCAVCPTQAWGSGAAGSAAPRSAENPPTVGTQPLERVLNPFSLTYTARLYGLTLTARANLEPVDGGYEYRLETEALIGQIRERSRFQLTSTGNLRPLRYAYLRRGLGTERRAELAFDWDAGTVAARNEPERPPVALTDGTLDPLSAQIQLRAEVARGRDEFVVPIYDGKRIRMFRFSVEGRERLSVGPRELETVRVRRVREARDDKATLLWLASGLEHLIVRLDEYEGGALRYQLLLQDGLLDGVRIDAR